MANDNPKDEIKYSPEQIAEDKRRRAVAAKRNKKLPDPREESAEPEPAGDTAPPTPTPSPKKADKGRVR